MKLLAVTLLISVNILQSISSDVNIDALVNIADDEPSKVLKRAADDSLPQASSSYPYFFELKDGSEMAARLNLTKGPFVIELVKTTKNSLGEVVLEMNATNKRAVKQYGHCNFTGTPQITVKRTESAPDANQVINKTSIDVSFTYTNPDSCTDNFTIKSSVLKFTVQWGVPTRRDYWNVTSASLVVDAKIDSNDQNITVDLTPKFSYTGQASDSACTNGYGICAPLNLCWTCDDQVLRPNNLTKVGDGKYTFLWHLPGMVFEPELGETKDVEASKFKFSFTWDCDPLIPLSVWVSLLLTLLMASILIWAIQMLSALSVPNKWDDPKKPGIQVAQTE